MFVFKQKQVRSHPQNLIEKAEVPAFGNKIPRAQEDVEGDGRINLKDRADKLFPDKNPQDQRDRVQSFLIALSYAREDDGAVQKIVKKLDSHLRPWAVANKARITWLRDKAFPEELALRNPSKAIPTGNEFDEDIDLRFNTANLVLGFLSPAYVASDYIRKEEWKIIQNGENYQRALVEINPYYDKENAEKLFPRITRINHMECHIDNLSALPQKEEEVIFQLYKDIKNKLGEQQEISKYLGWIFI